MRMAFHAFCCECQRRTCVNENLQSKCFNELKMQKTHQLGIRDEASSIHWKIEVSLQICLIQLRSSVRKKNCFSSFCLHLERQQTSRVPKNDNKPRSENIYLCLLGEEKGCKIIIAATDCRKLQSCNVGVEEVKRRRILVLHNIARFHFFRLVYLCHLSWENPSQSLPSRAAYSRRLLLSLSAERCIIINISINRRRERKLKMKTSRLLSSSSYRLNYQWLLMKFPSEMWVIKAFQYCSADNSELMKSFPRQTKV